MFSALYGPRDCNLTTQSLATVFNFRMADLDGKVNIANAEFNSRRTEIGDQVKLRIAIEGPTNQLRSNNQPWVASVTFRWKYNKLEKDLACSANLEPTEYEAEQPLRVDRFVVGYVMSSLFSIIRANLIHWRVTMKSPPCGFLPLLARVLRS